MAFVDILGFRNIVARMQKEQGLFSTVRDALKTINKQARSFAIIESRASNPTKPFLRAAKRP